MPRGVEFDESTLTDSYGKMTVQPLEKGFGITLGNSLRRVLLSSLQGAAVTSIQVDNVLHEFTSIPGVKEDITDIILNLKQLRLKLHEGDSDTIRLEVSGENEVRAKDLVTSEKLEVLNPDLHIATVGPEGKLKITMAVRMSKGYVPAEQKL